jgi:pimeloyl-ACP methyl ester carboxylesterase
MTERAVLFGPGRPLVGVLTEAADPAVGRPAVLFLNAGLLHHVGPNRIYVKIARCLAQNGFHSLRFDLSGIGDSRVRTEALSLEERVLDDVAQAMTYLNRAKGTNEFILIGHCAGAFISYGVAARDPRVVGVVMINAEGGDEQWKDYDRKRKTSRYYENYYGRGVLANPEKWKKLLTGRADYGSIFRNVFQNILWNKISAGVFKVKAALFGAKRMTQRRELANIGAGMRELAERGTRLLILYSQGSSGLERTRLLIRNEMQELNASGRVQLEVVAQADHTFTLLAGQQNLVQAVAEWIRVFVPDAASVDTHSG